MDLTLLALIAHLIGAVMGVGGATATDAMFLRSLKDKKVTEDEINLIKTVSYVVITGLAIAILSGLYLFLQNTALLSSSGFQIKMTIVLLLTINGTLFHIYVLPLMEKYKDGNFANDEIKSKLWLFAATGGTSAISWYSVLVLGVVMRFIEWPYLFLLNGYILLVFTGALSAYMMLRGMLFSSGKNPVETGTDVKKISTAKKFPMFLAVSIILLAIAFASQAYFIFLKAEPETEVVEENVVEFEMRVIENQWKWDPALITVPVGSHVRINIFNEDFYAHGFAIDAFGVDEYLSARKTTSVEFTADTPGEYEFYCSVICGEGHDEQVGRLIVTE